MSAEQKKLAILPGEAPADIITKQDRTANIKTFLPAEFTILN